MERHWIYAWTTRQVAKYRLLTWWFTVDTEDDDVRRRATSFLAMCFIGVAGTPIFMAGSFGPQYAEWSETLFALGSSLVSLLTYVGAAVLARRGEVNAAGLVVPGVLALNVCMLSVLAQEVDYSLFILIFCPLLASFAVRPAFIFLACVFAWVCASITANVLVPQPMSTDEITILALTTILLFCVGVALYLATHITSYFFDQLVRTRRDLDEARLRAEEANLAKSQFLANVSHELRTPLNAIIGYTELMREEAEELEIDAFDDDLDRVGASGQVLLALIDDVLDLSKIDAAQVVLYAETFSLSEALRDVVGRFAEDAKAGGNRLALDVDMTEDEITTDRDKLQQILGNLVSNAVKFTRDGVIQVSASVEGEQVLVCVEDTGTGIDAKRLATIFEPFGQDGRALRSVGGGTGLGLSLSKRLAMLLRGEISATSTLGEGSVFTLRIPKRLEVLRDVSLEISGPIRLPSELN